MKKILLLVSFCSLGLFALEDRDALLHRCLEKLSFHKNYQVGLEKTDLKVDQLSRMIDLHLQNKLELPTSLRGTAPDLSLLEENVGKVSAMFIAVRAEEVKLRPKEDLEGDFNHQKYARVKLCLIQLAQIMSSEIKDLLKNPVNVGVYQGPNLLEQNSGCVIL